MNEAPQTTSVSIPAVRRAASAPAVYLAGLLILLLLAPYVVPSYQEVLLTYGLVMGIAALGFNLLLGYTGLLSFGHAAFFGAAAYLAGFLVKYLHVTSMEAFLAAGVGGCLVLAALFGFVCVRYTRIFFSILTLALSQVLWGLALKYFWITGGTDGLRIPTPTLLGGLLGATGDKFLFLSHVYYYYVLGFFVVAVGITWLMVNSPFGKALQAIRDNETRAQFIGIPVRRYRWVAFVVSGALTGLAGVLWAPLNGLITPDTLYWPFSGEIVFMTVLGGFRSFAGPVLGAVVYTYLKSYAIGVTTYWQALLGITLVVLVRVMPEGLIGILARVIRKTGGGA